MRSGNPRILVELPGDNYCLKQLMIIGNMEYLLGLVDATRGKLAEYKSKDGSVMLRVIRQGRSGLVLRVTPNSGASYDELVEACARAIREFS
jgi:hypothetical protein